MIADHVGMTARTVAADKVPCAAHREGSHRPRPLVNEYHHVVPQAWQRVWVPDPHTQALAATGLWDPRTIPLCPTAHRNVHWWVVRLMREGTGQDVDAARRAARRGMSGLIPPEVDIACLALRRFIEAGGTLDLLRSRGQWGEA